MTDHSDASGNNDNSEWLMELGTGKTSTLILQNNCDACKTIYFVRIHA